jgi:hypothetical protein
MSKNIKRLLLLANILLLILICFFVVKSVNGRAAAIATQRITAVCNHIITQMDSGNMTLKQAAEYTAEASRTGDYVPSVEVFKGADGIVVETNDPSIMVNILKKKETKFARVNCSKLVQQ